MNNLHTEFDTMGPRKVEVTISRPANVLIMDSSNYYLYMTGGDYSYYGGYFSSAGSTLTTLPYGGHWHLVVNTGGEPYGVQASYRILLT